MAEHTGSHVLAEAGTQKHHRRQALLYAAVVKLGPGEPVSSTDHKRNSVSIGSMSRH